MMLKDAQKVLDQNRHVVDEHHKAMGITSTPTPPAEDMIVGDVITNNTYTSTAPVTSPSTPATSGTSTLAKAAIAGVAAAGLGSGVGVPLAYMLSQSDQQPAPVVQPASDMDTDTQYGLRIYRGDEEQAK